VYKTYFGLREKPFGKTPDPRFLFLSRGHDEALARLEYAVEEREIALLTGDVGRGKTTLSRALMDRCGASCRFVLIFNPRMGGMEFLRTVAHGFEINLPARTKDDLLRQITGALYELYRAGISPVLVIDEAQTINDLEVFDEIRLLTNYQLDHHNLLSVLIMGQPELRTILRCQQMEPLRQRIALQYHLQPLSLEETMEYLDFRVTAAGGVAGLFTPDALQTIHELSGGVPRRINALATNALLVAYGADAAMVDAAIVHEVRDEVLF
jgi:type II secretory pathway predicted ATPase ExeA